MWNSIQVIWYGCINELIYPYIRMHDIPICCLCFVSRFKPFGFYIGLEAWWAWCNILVYINLYKLFKNFFKSFLDMLVTFDQTHLIWCVSENGRVWCYFSISTIRHLNSFCCIIEWPFECFRCWVCVHFTGYFNGFIFSNSIDAFLFRLTQWFVWKK